MALSPVPPRIKHLRGRLEDPLAFLVSCKILRLGKVLFSRPLNGSLYAISVVFLTFKPKNERLWLDET